MRKKQNEESNFNWSQILIGLITAVILGGGGYTLFVKDGHVSIEPIAKKDEASSERKSIENFGSPSQNFNVSGGSIELSTNKSTITNSTVNSNNNSNNKTEQKIENNQKIENIQQGSQTINNFTNGSQSLSNDKPKSTGMMNQTTNKPQMPRQQFQSPPVAQVTTLNDSNIENYLALIESHRNRGAGLAKCDSVRLCLALYNNWQDQANNLLDEIDNYIRQRYRKRSELQQEFGSETLTAQIFIDTKDSLESLRTIFFTRAKTFGSMTTYLKNSLG